MRINERQVADVMVLELDGRLILEEGESPLRETVDRLVKQGHVKILVDLRGVTKIDSAGIGMLVSKYLTAFRHGGRVKRLCTVFEMFDSEDEALRSFETTPSVR